MSHAISYLEVLDDEYWDLSGQARSDSSAKIREAYVKARTLGGFSLTRAESDFRHDVIARLHQAKRSGLCFSGGGIRSATFGLGVLQGLAARAADGDARPKLLGEFDFLSTVSGGGYLGSWFSGWATRKARPSQVSFRDAADDECDGPAQVMRELAKNPDVGFDPEPMTVRHLRAFSNFITPRLGLSADTGAIAATVVRNMFLNWLVLVPILAAFLLVPVGAQRMLEARLGETPQAIFLYAGFLFGVLATGYVGFDLPSAGNARRGGGSHLLFGLLPLLLSAGLLNTYWGWRTMTSPGATLPVQQFAWFGAAMHGGGMLAGILVAMISFRRPAPRTGIYATLAAAFTGAVAGVIAFAVTSLVGPIGVDHLAADTVRYTCIAFPLATAIFLVAGALLVGLTSYITEDKDREWWARAGGMLLGATLSWPVFASLVLYATTILHSLATMGGAAVSAVTAGWATASLAGSARTASGRRNDSGINIDWISLQGIQELASRLALPVFLGLLTLLLACLNTQIITSSDGYLRFGRLVADGSLGMVVRSAGVVIALACAYLFLGVGSSFFINVNTFSLHAMYKQRLIRAYLGASNSNRQPHLFTGFDEGDNMPICALTRHKPLHVVNMALNLVGGKNLAWQQRKAESFTSTRLHTGSCRVGYRPSTEYGGKYSARTAKTAISLGTAMTISGAAASPNMGYNSSPLLTVVMTLFNARLGWWLGNPSSPGDTWKMPGPRFGIRAFLDEMLGMTDDLNTWIYLSDGGHFENLGLYELVLRRCSVIVVSDAGADPSFAYEDLGNAVRKIRVDLGIPIDFDTPMPMSPSGRRTADFAGHHCAIGRIRYSGVDDVTPHADGVLIYLKPSLTGDEPADVRHYASKDEHFPHQSTTDQSFDEAQFESYRRLGLHVIERICREGGHADPQTDRVDLDEFITRVRSYIASPQP